MSALSQTDLEEIVVVSQTLGANPFLVLHGGGNTSVKSDDGLSIAVKGSGHDMATIGPEGFAPLRLEAVRKILERTSITDSEMVTLLRSALHDQAAPIPSIEATLHAILPGKFVVHTHADAIVALTNTVAGEDYLSELTSERLLVFPYCKPGFELAQMLRANLPQLLESRSNSFVLANHGLFTFADTRQTALAEHLSIVKAAEDLIRHQTGVLLSDDGDERVLYEVDEPKLTRMCQLIEQVSGGPVFVQARQSAFLRDFVAREDLGDITQRGPATLEHVIYTKRVPLLGDDVDAFVSEYHAYFERNRHRSLTPLQELDPIPRIILDRELGLVAVGRSSRAADVAADIYRHTINIILAAEALGGYRAISEGNAFDIEYWELEQAKLR